jgi:signal transduction histidine kinase
MSTQATWAPEVPAVNVSFEIEDAISDLTDTPKASSPLTLEEADRSRIVGALPRTPGVVKERPEEATQALDGALERTELAQAVKALGDELASHHSSRGATHNPARFQVVVEGPPLDLHPILRDDIYAIAREAVRNAFRHAQARHIEADIRYGGRMFQLRVRDDGKGIEPGIVAEGRSGHYGVLGMRERAKRIGGKLDVWTGIGAGTEIELSIPGSIAYKRSTGRTVLGLFRKARGREQAANG